MIDVNLEIGERQNEVCGTDGEYDWLMLFYFGVSYEPGERANTIVRKHYYRELLAYTPGGRSLFEGYSFCRICGALDYDGTRVEESACRRCGGDLLAEQQVLTFEQAIEEILSRGFRADLEALRRDYYEASPEHIIGQCLATAEICDPPTGKYLMPELYRDFHCERYRGAVRLAPALAYLPARQTYTDRRAGKLSAVVGHQP